MKKTLFLLIVVIALFPPVRADYDSDLRDAAKAYKEGRLQESLNLYTAAYEQNPTYQVKAYIVYLKNKLRNEGEEPEYTNPDVYSDWEKRGSLITCNVPALLGLMVFLHAETAVGGYMGVALNGGAMFSSSPTPGESSYMTGLEYNFYPQGHALNGWYVGPILNIYILTQEYQTGDDEYGNPVYNNKLETSLFPQAGGHFGYRWIWDSGFTLDLNLGEGLVFGNGFIDFNIGSPGANSIVLLPVFGCDMGYAW
jgi:hypothetical protein